MSHRFSDVIFLLGVSSRGKEYFHVSLLGNRAFSPGKWGGRRWYSEWYGIQDLRELAGPGFWGWLVPGWPDGDRELEAHELGASLRKGAYCMKTPEDRTGLRAQKLTTSSPELHFPSLIPEFLVKYGSRLEFNLCWDTKFTSLELSCWEEGRALAQDHFSRRVDFPIVWGVSQGLLQGGKKQEEPRPE